MDDKNLKDLFSGFDPEISSDNLFMSRLQRSLDSVEIVKQHTEAVARRQRRAVVWATFAGFVAGVVMALISPYIIGWLSGLEFKLPAVAGLSPDILITTMTFAVIAAVSVAISLGVYDLVSTPVTERSGQRPV